MQSDKNSNLCNQSHIICDEAKGGKKAEINSSGHQALQKVESSEKTYKRMKL
jgi:hypothetical protein